MVYIVSLTLYYQSRDEMVILECSSCELYLTELVNAYLVNCSSLSWSMLTLWTVPHWVGQCLPCLVNCSSPSWSMLTLWTALPCVSAVLWFYWAVSLSSSSSRTPRSGCTRDCGSSAPCPAWSARARTEFDSGHQFSLIIKSWTNKTCGASHNKINNRVKIFYNSFYISYLQDLLMKCLICRWQNKDRISVVLKNTVTKTQDLAEYYIGAGWYSHLLCPWPVTYLMSSFFSLFSDLILFSKVTLVLRSWSSLLFCSCMCSWSFSTVAGSTTKTT